VSVKRIEIDAGDEAAVEPQATRIKLASGQGEA
jgi:hypothetical protein